ncbi:NO-inducible flavohemoprotein [Aureibacter tunicatorum]|uniref:Flavohemoprotein n=1 Tax=Aureibacter tunicatorum TaxID=866807 RepID=A0AAE3XT50_9BACT|nr:NO-inducible flavohemoprotein [Aureibacter tunicatorum]MDR6241396.1 nitric oxide dioxygenase [Aureibacter tunicatorum]BDD06759.1 flavohemoprotein [Aureibacter tunicatorum]
MIKQETIDIIHATVPVLEKYGETISKHFYKRMFERHPELKNIFNMTHQAKGDQPRVLANAILQYAKHIDKLEMLNGTVESIAQKHTSLSITPEMYDIVGENLLAAIKEVLGDAATDDIINAWAEAYGVLADILINREEEIYHTKEQEKGGFRGIKEFIVDKKIKESESITSFYLKPYDNKGIPDFIPGQYIAISLKIDEGHLHTRNYSLSDAPNEEYLRISVKKEGYHPKGIVSNYLHDHVNVGDKIQIGIPAGVFTLKKGKHPILLISGGVGITPLISMYKVAKEQGRKVDFIQCAKNSNLHAFKTETHKDSTIIYEEPLEGDSFDHKGSINKEVIKPLLNKETEVYFCGSKKFMENVLQILQDLGVDENKIHYEFFGPSEVLQNKHETTA